MDKLVKTIKASGVNTKQDDDLIDRLNSRYTVIIIVAFAMIVTSQQYFIGKPLNCWEPKHFTGSHRKFMNAICWVNNTYYLPKDMLIDHSKEKKTIPYYQWIPFILLGQAFFFYLPSLFWHSLNQKAGVDSDDILRAANKISYSKNPGDRQKMVDHLTSQIDLFLVKGKRKPPPNDGTLLLNRRHHISTSDISSVSQQSRNQHPGTFDCLLKFAGNIFSGRFSAYLLTVFLISKILYVVNVFSQILALNGVLGINYGNFGIGLLTEGRRAHWRHSLSNAFPKETMCDFRIRRVGNVQQYTVQCVLPINMYNEVIYLFLWFWFMAVSILTVLNLLFWLVRSLLRCDKVKYVLNHITFNVDKNGRIFNRFLDDYLGQDGVFLIRLIGHNCNFITTNDITTALWKKYEERNISPDQEEYARSEV
ncbi:unnamed protein product [Dimorphilus gyrociliatus]|uniref:Innexin n=1 Tax=Dimorphilus gyrociliatus TaxID=2664684 RepID=A0A7I8VUJ2_9ANNE|nr:unnamed protein product [Dimorphilus gyrociliatus]